jgi:ribonuclease J
VTIWKACKKAGRQFIVDMYTAEMLRATGNERMPQADWRGIRVFLPNTQRWRIKGEQAFHISDSYKPYRIHWNQLAGATSKSVMLFRPSMVRDLEQAGCLEDGCVVCSEWAGYLEKEKNRWFVDWMKRTGIPMHPCHTSGHASVPDLRRMRDAFPDAIAVPVHLEDRERFQALFSNVRLREDGEWWEV